MGVWMGESVGVVLCVGLSGTVTVRVYVVQVYSLHQIKRPAPHESNSRASAALHPCPGDRWALCLCTQALKLHTGPVLVQRGSRQIRSALSSATRPWGAHHVASHCWTQGRPRTVND